MIIKKLPHWVLSSKSPSFYETEGGTAIEQTAIMYKKVQELIAEYNSFVDEINTKVEEFIADTLADQETFEISINQMIHDFTTLVETELKAQDSNIEEAIQYMKDHIDSSVSNILLELFRSKQITLAFNYNTETESLDIEGVVVGGSN
jgi:hypothetical protein